MDTTNYFPRGMIQVAGVHDPAEAQMLLHLGVDLIGIPLRLPVNQEDLSEAEAAALCTKVPGKCCLITYLDDPAEIISLIDYLKVPYLQLHGEISLQAMAALRAKRPEINIIKSLVVGKGPDSDLLASLKEYSPYSDAFITDTFNAATGAEGATGLTHDWAVSRQIVQLSEKPVILAGGLVPSNVEDAIEAVQPHGVDVHTGVEGPDGRKCPSLMRAFIEAAQAGFSGN